MAETPKCCENVFPGSSIDCGRPAHRVSQGRHYCRDHFYDVIDEAKTEVVNGAAEYFRRVTEPSSNEVDYKAWAALKRLKEHGWEPGD